MSKQALEILKSKMTLEERKKFVENCVKQNGEEWWKSFDGRSIGQVFNCINFSFSWSSSNQGNNYWLQIYNRFTDEEKSTIIQL